MLLGPYSFCEYLDSFFFIAKILLKEKLFSTKMMVFEPFQL
ncbi:hypothetical protein EV11_1144 [Prochlorococcus sp. SS52]|uniref:Uncharacterized protein n=1 Tax=Prochlorococcus marinus (strain SARG / CCMP1375 / SS120) TaxID=167539 RepID=Q7VB56_PROMA|nr:Predicted protein [Prochlorococcus marinus subsp. marinus str. CCMP1375]KGG14098.1 hypothetical protein EV04_0583 [Prochlorococcus marinus str. LG]KGG20734.1 hypothetical protein EV08_0938 [Prochlorococcus marinus str. SS2]KGG25135.1 hypothetical protein EV09_0029 [Prochlorococcus marinus str. SS35]KGG33313.1 hypothetical protein EV10_0520 [Prochlorococcus marinus str. SS51]KGG35580.1 hypothetical protein EV11_1144 [Prochlorococcus sp. SS52]